MGPNQICPTFWINSLQDLHRQWSNFKVLMWFLKRAREAASWISIGTCCYSWLAQYGIASSLDFSEWGFSVCKMWEFWRLHIFSLNLKISFIMSGECPFRYLKTSIINEFKSFTNNIYLFSRFFRAKHPNEGTIAQSERLWRMTIKFSFDFVSCSDLFYCEQWVFC